MPDVDTYLPVVSKLLQRTSEGKIEWKGTYESSIFICAVEGEFSFEIERTQTTRGAWARRFTMKDAAGEEVFVMRAISPTSETSHENDKRWEMLDDLYERARRIALNIDKKVADVSKVLDSM